jgi:hypothetical protein
MNLQILEDRVQEIDRAVHELLDEIRRIKDADSGSSLETKNGRQVEIAQRMKAARDAMSPLGMSVKALVEEDRGR